MPSPAVVLDARSCALRRALRLEYLTVGWNLVEGGVGLAAALTSSIALLGFGVDSFVECASSLVLIWRLAAERRGMDHEAVETVEERAQKLVGASLFLLAAYIAVDAGLALWHRDRSSSSPVGMRATALSLFAMAWLARAKRHAAAALGSRALQVAQRAIRLVVDGPGGRARDDLVHRARGAGSLARGGVRLLTWPHAPWAHHGVK